MAKFFELFSKAAGLPPGTIVHVGDKKRFPVTVRRFFFNKNKAGEEELSSPDAAFPGEERGVAWFNVEGIHEPEVIEKLGKNFRLHPLTMEDIANSTQRPKFEDFGEYILLVLKIMNPGSGSGEIKPEQLSIIIGKNYVLSFQESERGLFDGIKNRIRTARGRIRTSGADYLAYALIDSVVDGYFTTLEKLGDSLETVEEGLLDGPGKTVYHKIHALKRELIFLRKSVWPLREVISALKRSESSLVSESTTIYLNDLYDHTIQVMDTVETFRDILSGMLDIYLSSISNKMNEVMKVLTIIATIFIPLTFIAGIYGMNFENMPELSWSSGYFIVLVCCL